jgi:hypothetical protein
MSGGTVARELVGQTNFESRRPFQNIKQRMVEFRIIYIIQDLTV